MNKNEPAIKVEDLTVAYHDKPVLWDVDLTVPPGVLMGILGPNGAGKSTLMKSILGLVKPAAGSVEVFGESYKKQKHLVSYVPQRSSVDWDFPTNVMDVVLMGSYGRLGLFKRPGKKEKELAMDVLEKVQLTEYASRQISQLSGGQQQRVFLARALMQDAAVYLMDEPFQGVDAATEKTIIRVLKILKEAGKTVVVVHHDLQTVEEYFDRIALLNVRIVASGKVEDIYTHENLHATYGSKNFLAG